MNLSEFAYKFKTSGGELVAENIFAISANKSISAVSKIEDKSLIHIMNNRRPKWESCGTP